MFEIALPKTVRLCSSLGDTRGLNKAHSLRPANRDRYADRS
jgi:hypothetical protein